jgi:DNA polymerase-3 subunit alpha
MMADLTDQSGKWGATCFSAEAQEALAAALAAGEPLLLDVELQWREGDESPRLTIQNATPLNMLLKSARARLEIRLKPDAGIDLVPMLAAYLQRGGKAIAEVKVPRTDGGEAQLLLGRNFLISAGADIGISQLPGVESATVSAMGALTVV